MVRNTVKITITLKCDLSLSPIQGLPVSLPVQYTRCRAWRTGNFRRQWNQGHQGHTGETTTTARNEATTNSSHRLLAPGPRERESAPVGDASLVTREERASGELCGCGMQRSMRLARSELGARHTSPHSRLVNDEEGRRVSRVSRRLALRRSEPTGRVCSTTLMECSTTC